MSDKHTPVPWSIDNRFATMVKANNGQSICGTGGYSDNRRDPDELKIELEANARFIVTACNHHAELVEALRECVSCFNCPEWSDRCEEVEQRARDLLTKLEREG